MKLSGFERRKCSDLSWTYLGWFEPSDLSRSFFHTELLDVSMILFPTKKSASSQWQRSSWGWFLGLYELNFFHCGWSSQVQYHSALETHKKQILCCLTNMKPVLFTTNTREHEWGSLCLWYKRINEQCFIFWRTRSSKPNGSNTDWKDKKMYMSVTGLWQRFISSSILPFLCHSRKDFREENYSKLIYKLWMTAVGLITAIYSRITIPTFSNLWWLKFLKIVRKKGVVLCNIKVHQHQALWE